MKFEERDLVLGTAGRLARFGPPPAASSREEDLEAARRFLGDLCGGREPACPSPDVQHAACSLLSTEADPVLALSQVHDLFAFLAQGEPSAFAEECADLRAACAFAGWRAAGGSAMRPRPLIGSRSSPISPTRRARASPSRRSSRAVRKRRRWRPASCRIRCARSWLALGCGGGMTRTPKAVRAAAERLFALVGERSPENDARKRRSTEGSWPSWREWAAGISTAGPKPTSGSTVRRNTSGRPEAPAQTSLALSYQRLAVRIEERQLQEVAAAAPVLGDTFRGLGMLEDELKCRFLEGLCLVETDELPRASAMFREICAEAERLGYEKLLATAQCDLVNIYAMMGDARPRNRRLLSGDPPAAPPARPRGPQQAPVGTCRTPSREGPPP